MLHRPGVVLVFAGVVAAAVLVWAARGPVTRPSVAVRLEYQGNGSADESRVADGITIEITRLLAQVDGLDVRPATPASRYGDAQRVTQAAGAARGPELVLTGLVLSDAGAVRYIRVSLVSTRRWTALWSGSFTPENNDILGVHGRIVAAVADVLGLRRLPGQRQYSLDPVLQTSFLRARALQANGGNVARSEAVELFAQITRQASSFTPGFAALATTLGGHLSIAGPPPLESNLAVAARAAYEADPQLAEANVAMGLLSARQCQWPRADAYFAEAFRLDRSDTTAYTDFVISTLLPLGRITEALDVLRQALTADPTSVDVRRTLTYVQLQHNDFVGASETSRWVIKHDPELEFADQSHGRALYLSGRIAEALEWFGRSDGQWGHRGYLLALMGRHGEARALAESHPGEPARQLLVYAGLQDVERALDALQRTALDNPWRALVWMRWPEIEPIFRGDPRAPAIRAQLLRPVDEGRRPLRACEVFTE